jgi:TRAP-type C4-dicarboxylate transport system permease small subunit
MRAVQRGVAILAGAAEALACLSTLICLVLICVSVGARYFLHMPIPWIDKVAGWCVLGMVLLAAPEAQRRFEHIGVDVATGAIGPRLARAAHLLGVVSVGLVAAILLDSGIETVSFSQMIGVVTEVFEIPQWYVQLLLPVGAALLLIVAVGQAVVLAAGRDLDHLPDGDTEAQLTRDPLSRGE